MGAHRLQIVGVRQDNTFRTTGSSRRINNGSDVFRHCLAGTNLYRAGRMGIISQADKIIKIDRLLILRI